MSIRAQMIIRIGGWLSFFCTMVLGLVMYITLDGSAPFKTTDSVTNVTKQNGVNVLVESRGFLGEDTQELVIFRTLHRQGNVDHSVAVEGGSVVNQKDEFIVLRSIVLPTYLTGAWCSKAVVFWRPTLSLIQHKAALPELCFEVPDHD
jgi:hypothetical protein